MHLSGVRSTDFYRHDHAQSGAEERSGYVRLMGAVFIIRAQDGVMKATSVRTSV